MSSADVRAAFAAAAAPRAIKIGIAPAEYIRGLSTADVSFLVQERESKHQAALVVALGVCDAAGQRVFDAQSAEDIALIESLPFEAVSAIAKAINEASGLTAKAAEEAKKD